MFEVVLGESEPGEIPQKCLVFPSAIGGLSGWVKAEPGEPVASDLFEVGVLVWVGHRASLQARSGGSRRSGCSYVRDQTPNDLRKAPRRPLEGP